MRSGRVCEKHGQWCPDRACPYCLGPVEILVGVNPVMVLHLHECALDGEAIRRLLDSTEFRKALREGKP